MSREYHWWLYVAPCTETGGMPFLVYACPDHGGVESGEDAARSKGFEMLSGYQWQTRRLPTRDKSAASQFIRGKRLESGEGLRSSIQRIGHEKSVARWRRGRAERRTR